MPIILRAAFLFLLFPSIAMSAAYYVNCEDGGSNAGTFANPWTSFDGPNDKSNWVTGDDLYIKDGTTCSPSAGNGGRLVTDWAGTSENRVIIGCYDGEGDFDCTGKALPIIEGDTNNYPTVSTQELLKVGGEYTTVQHLDIRDSYRGYGVGISDSTDPDYVILEYLTITGTWMGGIYMPPDTNGSIIRYNDISIGSKKFGAEGGTSWPVGGVFSGSMSTIEYNYIHDTWGEGILLNGGSTAQYNIIKDTHSVGIYVDAQDDNTIRHNLIFGTTDTTYIKQASPSYHGTGIKIAVEAFRNSNCDNNDIYGNIVINTLEGIKIASENPSYELTDIVVYNNTFIDNYYNIRMRYGEYISGCALRNNIFYTMHSDSTNSKLLSDPPTSTTWSNNAWYGENPIDDFVGSNDQNIAAEQPMFEHEGIFRGVLNSLSVMTMANLALVPNSLAIDNGFDLGANYDDAFDPSNTDFTNTPDMTVTLVLQDSYGADWDFGAVIYNLFISDAYPISSGIPINADLSWSNPTGANNVDVYFEEIAGACDLQVGDRVADDQDVETYDPSVLSLETDYCWRVDVNHDGGTETGTVYEFTTTDGPPAPAANQGGMNYSTGGAKVKSSNGGMTVK